LLLITKNQKTEVCWTRLPFYLILLDYLPEKEIFVSHVQQDFTKALFYARLFSVCWKKHKKGEYKWLEKQ